MKEHPKNIQPESTENAAKEHSASFRIIQQYRLKRQAITSDHRQKNSKTIKRKLNTNQ
jgi:hypothetical protein